jgi:hypothetical protein
MLPTVHLNMSKLTLLPVLLFAVTISSCARTVNTIYYNPTGTAQHFSGSSQTHFGALHVWNASDFPNTNDVGYIITSEVSKGVTTKYLVAAPRLMDQYGWHLGTTLDNFDLRHSISMPDSDVRAFLSALQTVSSAPANDSSYVHYACDAQLNIAPTTVSTNARGFSTVSTGVASETTWVTTCELTFYLGAGTMTLADGTSWTESIPLDKKAVQQMASVVQSAVTDLESQK